MIKKYTTSKTASLKTLCSRRSFLMTTLGSVLITQFSGCNLFNNDLPMNNARMPEWFHTAISDPDAASHFGETYLHLYPHENNRDILINAINKAVTTLNDRPVVSSATMIMIDRAIRTEYARAEIVSLQGWQLSRTEARLYALAALRKTELSD